MTNQIEALNSRTMLYCALQAQYSYPLSHSKLEHFLEFHSEISRLEEELRPLREVLAKVTDWGEFVERLNIEHTRLFDGPGQVPAPPYASFYLNDQRLMGPETMAVRRKYIQYGVASVHMGQSPDDHIALELAFMAYLNSEASSSLAKGEDGRCKTLIEAQANFLHDHLLTWVPQFCSNVISTTNEAFFTGLSKLTQVCLDEEV